MRSPACQSADYFGLANLAIIDILWAFSKPSDIFWKAKYVLNIKRKAATIREVYAMPIYIRGNRKFYVIPMREIIGRNFACTATPGEIEKKKGYIFR